MDNADVVNLADDADFTAQLNQAMVATLFPNGREVFWREMFGETLDDEGEDER